MYTACTFSTINLQSLAAAAASSKTSACPETVRLRAPLQRSTHTGGLHACLSELQLWKLDPRQHLAPKVQRAFMVKAVLQHDLPSIYNCSLHALVWLVLQWAWHSAVLYIASWASTLTSWQALAGDLCSIVQKANQSAKQVEHKQSGNTRQTTQLICCIAWLQHPSGCESSLTWKSMGWAGLVR